MELIKTIKTSNLRHWGDAFMWLLYALIGGLLPLWGGAILIKLSGKWEGISLFFHHGEFAIYSAALLAPTIYLITRAFRIAGKRVFLLFTFCFLFVSAILFAGVKSGELLGRPLDIEFLRNATLWLFAGSVVLSYLVNVFENVRLSVDIQQIREADYNNLSKKFDKLGE